MKRANDTFHTEATINAMLYIIERNGGMADMHRIFKTLYFADMEHLSKYGRSVTGDVYIAMEYGPVPSKTDDILKAVRGDSFFSDKAGDLSTYFHFHNRYMVKADKPCDTDWLSDTDMECLDDAIKRCEGKTFGQLTDMSHGQAWSNTARNRVISVKDILRESGESEAYAEYVAGMLDMEKTLL